MTKRFGDIRTGVIGVGSMGKHHARIYKEISNLIAISDTDKVHGKNLAQSLDVEWYSDYMNLLNEVDAVSIAVPTNLHRKISEDVARAGVHLLVEKPLAGNIQDSEQIISISRECGVKLAVGHIERHNPLVQKIKNNLLDKTWGNIISLSARRLSPYPNRITDVGVLFDLTIHDVDIFCYLVDNPVDKVCTFGGKFNNGENEDSILLSLGFTDGQIGHCETSWLYPKKIRDLNIITTKGHIRLDYLNQDIRLYSSSINKEYDIIRSDKVEPLKLELTDFLSSISNNRDPLISGEDGLTAVRIVQAALESLDKNKIVDV